MAQAVIMPRQGLSVETCIITEWKKDEGDSVKEGDVLFSYETDKATFEEEAEVEGTLLKRFFEEGDEVPVLTNVCVIGEEGESVEEFKPETEEEEEAVEEEVEKAEEEKAEVETETAVEDTKKEQKLSPSQQQTAEDIIRISPRARNLAQENNVDFHMAEGTGPKDRIIERDIEKLLAEGPLFTPAAGEKYRQMDLDQEVTGTGIGGRITTADLEKAGTTAAGPVSEPEFEDVELSNIRKRIGDSMYESIQSTAQLTLDASFDASAILEYRKKIKENREDMELENITLNDIILFTVSRTLRNYDELNAHFLEDKIRLFKDVNLGMAVDTDRGLIVPTIFSANLKSLNQLSREAKARVEECKEGTINPDYLQGATFTVTNLGTLEIESFTPVLNPPQTGILGVNTIEQKIKKVDGEYYHYPAMGLSLTFDHRAIDGAPAARFLQELKHNLEKFTLMMAR